MIADELARLRRMDPADRVERVATDQRAADYEAVKSGKEAEAALALLDPHFEALRTVCIQEMISSHPEHAAFRERMIVTCQILDAVRAAVHASANSGQVAEARGIVSSTISLRR